MHVCITIHYAREFCDMQSQCKEEKRTRKSDVLRALMKSISKANVTSKASQLKINLQRAGLKIRRRVPKDGNCLFHALCDQLKRIRNSRVRYMELRRSVIEYMRNHPTVVRNVNLLLMYRISLL